MPLVTGLHLDIKPLTTTLSATIQPIPYPWSGPSIESMSLQFSDEDIMQDSVKRFAQVRIDDICCSSLIHQRCNAVVEGHQICQAPFEAILAVSSSVLLRNKAEAPCSVHRLFEGLCRSQSCLTATASYAAKMFKGIAQENMKTIFPEGN